ncbi:MAG: hypothetical protein L0H39_06715, partial [Brachybacterium sp.]|nr:hypothetical protein [Brachybacterium sp.]
MSEGPFTPPPAGPVSKPGGHKKLIIAGVLGGGGCVLMLLVVLALIITFAVRGGGPGEGDEGSTVADLSPEEQATALVTEYFEALSAGDAGAALELLPLVDEMETEVLPTEAYTAALELAPVAGVEVGTPVLDGGLISGEVPVTFTVGGESFADTYSVHDYDDDGILELTGTSANFTVTDGDEGLGMTLNGAEVTHGQRLHLVPGGYEIAYGAEHFAPSSTDPVIVGEHHSSYESPDPELTEDGQKAFRAAVQQAVDACLAATTLQAGCGIGEVPKTSSDGWTMVEDTVKRSISEDTQRTIDTMEGTPSYDEATYVEGSSIGSVETTID